jgi:hypothetical protein
MNQTSACNTRWQLHENPNEFCCLLNACGGKWIRKNVHGFQCSDPEYRKKDLSIGMRVNSDTYGRAANDA